MVHLFSSNITCFLCHIVNKILFYKVCKSLYFTQPVFSMIILFYSNLKWNSSFISNLITDYSSFLGFLYAIAFFYVQDLEADMCINLTLWPFSTLSLGLYSSVTNTHPEKHKVTWHRVRRTLRHGICTLWGRAPGQLGWDSVMVGSLCHQLAGGATKRLNARLSPESTLIMSEHVNCECSVDPFQKTEPCIKICPNSSPLNSCWGS